MALAMDVYMEQTHSETKTARKPRDRWNRPGRPSSSFMAQITRAMKNGKASTRKRITIIHRISETAAWTNRLAGTIHSDGTRERLSRHSPDGKNTKSQGDVTVNAIVKSGIRN
jgi:hypothetical protein